MVKLQNSKLDYAAHQLEVKKRLKEIHDKLLSNQHGEAASLVDNAIVEMRMLKAAINSHVHT